MVSSLGAFKSERLCHNAYSKYSLIFGCLRNDRCCSCTCTASHTGCNKDHIRSVHKLRQIIEIFFRRFLSYFRIASRSETFSQLLSYLQFCLSLSSRKSLLVRIYCHKSNALHSGLYHAVYCVAAASAYTDYLYLSGTCIIYLKL